MVTLRKVLTVTLNLPLALEVGTRKATDPQLLWSGQLTSFAWEGWWREETPTWD